ncbi:MAG: VacB/RNase II family 3'-5' exoribonuclease [Simkaniaceae bacterium]|nr:VacB/RNase II family 3'-5' exoribonuclease [Simkaniaceae bacterium]
MKKTGVIYIHSRGFGFVAPDDGSEEVFIPKHLVGAAIDKDKVEIYVMPAPKGPEGGVVEIIERSRKELVGIITSKGKAHVAVIGEGKEVVVKSSKNQLPKKGERVLLKVLDWGNEDDPIVTELIKPLGPITDASQDIPVAILEYMLKDEFSLGILTQAKEYGTKVKKGDLAGRQDFTKAPCITIDPATAKDFDDALSLHKDERGFYHLGVHIADVSHYVPEGSPLDLEAYLRGNSTYFPGSCLPMLPEQLSNALCSLVEGEIRLTASILMQFDDKGSLMGYEVTKGFIKSDKRFSYEEAKQVLDGTLKSPHGPLLHLMVELCALLKAQRHERGSVDLSLPDTVLQINKEGMPTGLHVVEYDITHQMVEEFMLKANEVVASHLIRHGKQGVFRIHEPPLPKNLADFASFVRLLGFPLENDPTQEDIQKLFAKVKDTSFSHQVSVAFIRSMKLAYYSPNNVGHFGLALEHYAHFTSPIRRYSDLVVHRLLFSNEPIPHLEEVAKRCSERERISFRAEMSVLSLKKLRFLKNGEKYEGVITKIKPFGFFFEIRPLMFEGFIHISQIGDDYYEFDQHKNLLYGRETGEIFSSGSAVLVELTKIDWIYQNAFWSLLQSNE